MATTEEILKAARDLGKLVSKHKAAAGFEDVVKKLEKDTEAQRAMTDYNRHMTTLAEKESRGKPIEVEDKRKVEALRDAVVRNALLGQFQMAQMDYLDLMRKVDEAISGESMQAPPGAGAGSSAMGGQPG